MKEEKRFFNATVGRQMYDKMAYHDEDSWRENFMIGVLSTFSEFSSSVSSVIASQYMPLTI